MRFCVRAARPCQHWSDRVRMKCLWIQLLAFASTANTRSPLHSLWVSRHAYCDSSPRTRPSRTAGPTARRLEFRSHLRIPSTWHNPIVTRAPVRRCYPVLRAVRACPLPCGLCVSESVREEARRCAPGPMGRDWSCRARGMERRLLVARALK